MITKVEKSERDEFELTEAINLLAKKNLVKVIDFKKYWFDFGKPEDINILEKFLNKCEL